VRIALQNAIRALLTEDRALANATVLGDLPINRAIRAIDKRCHSFVARHLPSAGHLRFVSSVLRMTIGIERGGDYAATIAREVSQLDRLPPLTIVRDIELLSEQVLLMFPQAITAFLENNAELARDIKVMESQIDRSYDKVFEGLLREGDENKISTRELLAILSVFNVLERVSDQAKNICEEAVFSAEGKTKPPKTYRVLFLDKKNNFVSQLAVAYAQKNFPDSIAARSRGWAAAEGLSPECLSLAERVGLNLGNSLPLTLELTADELSDYHVVVGLEPGAEEKISPKPFHTCYVEWDISSEAASVREAGTDNVLDATYKAIAMKVRELAELLRGEEAG